MQLKSLQHKHLFRLMLDYPACLGHLIQIRRQLVQFQVLSRYLICSLINQLLKCCCKCKILRSCCSGWCACMCVDSERTGPLRLTRIRRGRLKHTLRHSGSHCQSRQTGRPQYLAWLKSKGIFWKVVLDSRRGRGARIRTKTNHRHFSRVTEKSDYASDSCWELCSDTT